MTGGMAMPGGWTMSMMWMRMPGQTWPGAAASFVAIWLAMMAAMMLPSLVPMLVRYRNAVVRSPGVPLRRLTAIVSAGYFVVWALLGGVAFAVGVMLTSIAMQHPAISRAVPLATAFVMVIAGGLQFTAWKAYHLACCRESLGLMLPGDARTAWRHGLQLGVHCSASSAGLTALLFALGMMDVRAMLVVTTAVTVERLAPAGERIAHVVGSAIVAAGVMLIANAAL
jgi:predicted metal-binding membrane protein